MTPDRPGASGDGRPPPRLPLILFGVLALASVFAFYIVQHLKVQNPLINGSPKADPAVIDPRYAGVCTDANNDRVSFRGTRVGFYLQSKADTVTVEVINAEASPVATMGGSGRRMVPGHQHYGYFSWNGRVYGGGYAPAGTYVLRVVLKDQSRSFDIPGTTVTVQYTHPHPRVSAITVNQGSASSDNATTTGSTTAGTTASTTSTAATTSMASKGSTTAAEAAGTPTFTPGRQTATLHYAAAGDLGADALVYRANPNGTLTLVKTFGVAPGASSAVWDGMIGGRPAPAGSYLIGLSAVDQSCTQGQFPIVDDPAPGTTTGAGVNVTYLSATPPSDPVPAGQVAEVAVSSGGAHYEWALRLAGQRRVLERGRVSGGPTVRVRLPGIGLYVLSLRTATGQRTLVPLVASGVGARAAAKVLVVLPALSWQGDNAVDGDSDGLIDSLSDGGQINLARPLVAGLPADLSNEAALLDDLNSQRLSYDLTTDVALAQGVGPDLEGRTGVLLDGTFTWLPQEIVNPLGGFVKAGGAVFAAGVDSLEQAAPVTGIGGASGATATTATTGSTTATESATAGPARSLTPDPFGVTHGTIASTGGELITELTDRLGIFSDVAALAATRYQVLDPPGRSVLSVAGISPTNPAVIAFHLGRGTVVEAGLPDFGSELMSDVDARELLGRVWQVVLSR